MKSQTHTNATAALDAAERTGGHPDELAGPARVATNTMADRTEPITANRFVKLGTA